MNNTLSGKLTSRGNLNGNVNTIVFAHNYNDLTNKPQINNVTLQGNKTASELGLATPSDITVTSVNEQTGDVVLSGSDINYSVGMSLNAKIDDLESQIHDSGVETVNGMTGNVILTGNNINYSTGVTIKDKIDTVEGEIPTTYVSSVNGNSGAVILTGSNLEYSSGLSINDKIDAVEGEIPVVDYPVTSVNEKTGDVELTGADIPLGTDFSDPTSTAGAIDSKADKFKIDSFSKGSLSLNANGATNFNNSFITVPTGYSIGGVIDFSCGDVDVCSVNIQPTNTSNFAFVLRNTSSSAKSNITFTIKLLFVATGSIIT